MVSYPSHPGAQHGAERSSDGAPGPRSSTNSALALAILTTWTGVLILASSLAGWAGSGAFITCTGLALLCLAIRQIRKANNPQ